MWHLYCVTCVARPLPHLHPEAVHAGQVRGRGALGEVPVVHGDLGSSGLVSWLVVWLCVEFLHFNINTQYTHIQSYVITETKSHNWRTLVFSDIYYLNIIHLDTSLSPEPRWKKWCGSSSISYLIRNIYFLSHLLLYRRSVAHGLRSRSLLYTKLFPANITT